MKNYSLFQHKLKTSIFALLCVGALSSAPTHAAQTGALEEVKVTEKLIQIRPAESKEALKVEITTAKERYKVEEKIRFKVKGNQKFYLLLFNVDPESGKGIAILPNKFQGKDSIKYGADKWYSVPNKNLEFYSDRPGTERILMVASTKYIDPDKLLKKSKALGDTGFYLMDNLLDQLDGYFSDSYQKRIRVSSSSAKLPEGMVIKEVNLRIR